MHHKRLTISKLWPIPRKGNTFIVKPLDNKNLGIPVLVAMRDILGHVQKRKELKKIMLEGKVEVNGIKIREDGYSLLLFDILGLPILDKYYSVGLSDKGRVQFDEVKKTDVGKKIIKVVGKKVLSGGKVQFNMRDGRNLISKDKVSIGDSVMINIKDKKIEKVLPIKEAGDILVIKGKHLGIRGKVSKIDGNVVSVEIGEKSYNLNKEAVMALN